MTKLTPKSLKQQSEGQLQSLNKKCENCNSNIQKKTSVVYYDKAKELAKRWRCSFFPSSPFHFGLEEYNINFTNNEKRESYEMRTK